MDILLSFFFLLIATITGVSLCLFLGMKSYIKIALIVILLYIPMELYNDYFNISSLYDVYLKHELKIYNRYGKLIFNGNNSNKWDGSSNVQSQSTNKVPVGTYFYYLSLNNEAKDVISGYVYVNY